MRIAVIGGGAAGLSAAWMLSRDHEAVLFEAAAYLGGHANTMDVTLGGRQVPVDTGFIVFNEPNYPNLTRLFRAIGAETEPSDMSFSVSLGGGRVEYFGSPLGVFAQPSNLFRPDHWRMLRDIRRFSQEAPRLLAAAGGDPISLGQMLERGGYSRAFAREYLLPMAAAIWSSTLEGILEFPARSFIQFFVNHGLLDLTGPPPWRTVRGGSRTYVARLVETGRFEARRDAPVREIARTPGGVQVHAGSGEAESFDQVVFATPADRTLAILGAGASRLERKLLGAFRYQPNRAVVHGDRGLLPKRRRVWASWNYLAQDDGAGSDRVSVSYWMNRLQNLPVSEPVIVSLNPIRDPAPERVFAEFLYRHPQFDQAAIKAQGLMPAIQGVERTWFCGSYCGYGFHEDAVQAGLAVAAALGTPAPWADEIVPRSPAALAIGDPRMAAAE
jgi:predicted NAD/FAD-binding protein